ncbi:WD40-repeat-containing domain protein [Radiomyces spectabilis]|uniref:WD40-repeat-containing domain protein n=1 Tax=Radiomyces spectabilis TaxID=64574 RepID=UPI00221F0525|nr:WD40-repeat-containing domain protein [Radiomyces spectabilis]KAI8379727.1 WD40-repeat-containing domain protein [Radiomyces spectabilis]
MADKEGSTVSKLLGKPRIHFGSLEDQESVKRLKTATDVVSTSNTGIDLDALVESKEYDLSDTLRAAGADKQVLEEFERRKRARQIAVPTDDTRVRQRLREIGEPQCLFAEGPGDRRDRLRYLLSIREGVEIESAEEGSESEEEGEEEEQEEEFFTPGTPELLEARKWITRYSLPRAKERIQRERAEQETPLVQLKAGRKELHAKLKNYTNWASQIADERPVAQCTFSPDSSMLVTGAWSGLCRIWSVPQCEPILTMKGHNDRVGGVVFHPQATISQEKSALNLASSGADSLIHLWSLEKDTPIATLEGHARRVARIAFHPSGRYLGSASFDGTWRLWDVETSQELLLQEGHSKEVYAIGFQCDGSLCASGGLDATGRVWDMRTGRSAMNLEGHVKDIIGLDWSPNGYHVATASADNTVKIWDIRTLQFGRT